MTNTGKVAGDEVAQLYLTFPEVPGAPIRALRGFKRIHLEAGESQKVHFDLKPRDLSMVYGSRQSHGRRRRIHGFDWRRPARHRCTERYRQVQDRRHGCAARLIVKGKTTKGVLHGERLLVCDCRFTRGE